MLAPVAQKAAIGSNCYHLSLSSLLAYIQIDLQRLISAVLLQVLLLVSAH